ncbi:MAG: hypothetical protein HKM93_16210 [Desulfobacteraceae bacterium]|nr:hypothetical protein [Desulfobacteraceae bacterium]
MNRSQFYGLCPSDLPNARVKPLIEAYINAEALMKALIICLAVFTFSSWGIVCAETDIHKQRTDFSKPYMTIRLTYNYEVYKKPIFFKPKALPSFVVWVEEADSGYFESIFITDKAAKNKWTLKRKRPEVMPVWDGQKKKETSGKIDIDAISAATPKGDMVTIYWQIPESFLDKKIDVYIEANNSFDYNNAYHNTWGDPGYSSANGQPSIVWKSTITPGTDDMEVVSPRIIGHGHVLGKNSDMDPDLSAITTATQTFSKISIRKVTPYTSTR